MDQDIAKIKKYVRAANYIAASQIYLQDNFLLERPLTADDVKARLLGHWGTCPGINFVYANLNHLIKQKDAEMMFVLGPGHGFPALQANLFMEGTLGAYTPGTDRTREGLATICRKFSWPYGFPSHSNPEAPGVILEGGELGYALATSYGSILDNPNLITACLIGDGEAETGPTAAAWHINKFIDPKTNGAVLPILHLNGYKISGPTIFGRMSNHELISLFYGYGYEPHIIEGDDERLYVTMLTILDKCYHKIRTIQKCAREEGIVEQPRFPMIILRTPKGWTGIKELKGEKLEGNFASHQVIAKDAKTDKEELKALEAWLRSYNIGELFDGVKGFSEDILSLIPPKNLRIGESRHAFGGAPTYKPLVLPSIKPFCEDASRPGTIGSSSMRRAGEYLNEVFSLNRSTNNFRFLCPDETYSNKLDAIFKTTSRAFVWPIEPWDKDMSRDGRVMEILSEHTLQGLMQGYVLTGRHAVFASYEAFIQIIVSMVDQYAKFLKVARTVPWRGDVPSLNYILTSSGWRQEHNGFSHQNPGFIDDMLQRQDCFVNVYFPPDGNTTLAVLKKSLASTKEINIISAGKTQEPRWLTPELAERELEQGLMIWDFASDENPDIVLSAAGDYLTKEALAAIDIVKTETPEVKVRFVNILSLTGSGFGHSACKVSVYDFEDYFTKDKPVIFNFHGYPQTLKQLLFDYAQGGSSRFSIHGYEERGSTTTPFDMQVRNHTSRYNLAIEVFEKMRSALVLSKDRADELIKKYNRKLDQHHAYIVKTGVDLDEVENWQWKRTI